MFYEYKIRFSKNNVIYIPVFLEEINQYFEKNITFKYLS